MTKRWANDTQFEDSTITAVSAEEQGWSITKADGWSFWVPAESPVEPAIDMPVRMYGKGIGAVVRGLFLDGQCVFYRTEEEQIEHAAVEAYGRNAADLLSRWDEGRGVWSIACGGFGPGYEQALQVAAFEVLRHLVNGGDIEKAEDILPSLGYLGLSGAQWGAARSLALAFHLNGPRKVHDDCKPDRHIQVSKNFPSPALASSQAEIERLRTALEPFAKLGAEAAWLGKADDRQAWGFDGIDLTWGDFRRAVAALSGSKE
jgi:hypothetical protein